MKVLRLKYGKLEWAIPVNELSVDMKRMLHSQWQEFFNHVGDTDTDAGTDPDLDNNTDPDLDNNTDADADIDIDCNVDQSAIAMLERSFAAADSNGRRQQL